MFCDANLNIRGKQIMSDKVGEYWIGKSMDDPIICPNLNIFRFVNGIIDNLNGKNVLEIGFRGGENLKEFQRRGQLYMA
tara:strand:- start:1000 stop:1236 length:237 start_codon:yes stop_codon:yes gene_type:complete